MTRTTAARPTRAYVVVDATAGRPPRTLSCVEPSTFAPRTGTCERLEFRVRADARDVAAELARTTGRTWVVREVVAAP